MSTDGSNPENKKPDHPLLRMEAAQNYIKTWGQFIERWQKATTAEELNGLLHIAFDLPDEYSDPTEHQRVLRYRIEFFLGLASGCRNDGSGLKQHGTSWNPERDTALGERTSFTLPHKLATKAYQMLCQYALKGKVAWDDGNYYSAGWIYKQIVSQPDFSKQLLTFLVEMAKNRFGADKNSQGHNQTFEQFTLDVASLPWNHLFALACGSSSFTSDNPHWKEVLLAMQPICVELLCELGATDRINDQNWILSDEAEKRFERWILEDDEHHFDHDGHGAPFRYPTYTNEILFCTTNRFVRNAARSLALYRVLKAEREHQLELMEQNRKRKEEERKQRAAKDYD